MAQLQTNTEKFNHGGLFLQNPQADALEAADLPPKYDIVMGFDIPPPAYDTIINIEKLQIESEKCPKELIIQHI